jgi:hypothetical protein
MKRYRIAGLCLVVVFAIAALVTASASAAGPEYFECAKVAMKTGNFSDKSCTVASVPGKGKYELQPGIGKGKTTKGKGGKNRHVVPAVGGEVSCASFKSVGKLTSPKTSTIKITFQKCVALSKKCTSAGQNPGTIVTSQLLGELGYISKSPLKVGMAYTSEAKGAYAEFNCEGLEMKVTGSVIGEVTGNINTVSAESESNFELTGGGEQFYTSFEGGPQQVLLNEVNGSGPFKSGLGGRAREKKEKLMVKA